MGLIGRILRIVGIIFFGLATIMNLVGGVGTSCAAFLTGDYPSFSALIEQNMQWLYQGLVVATVLVGLAGIWVLVELIRGKKNSFRNSLIVLAAGTILAGIQYFSSLQLFGRAAPANMKFYINVITLILFLVLLIPGIREKVNFSREEARMDLNTAGGLAAIVMGVISLTTQYWAGPSHTYQGVNWVELLQLELNLSGILLTGAGVAILGRVILESFRKDFVYAQVDVPNDK